MSGPAWVYVEDVFERIPRRIRTDLTEISLPTWSRDCRWLYVSSGPAKAALFRVPASGGSAELVYNGVAINASEGQGGTLYFADAFEDARIRRLEPGHKEARELPEMPAVRFGTAWQLAGGGIYFVDASSRETGAVGYYDFASRSTRRIALLPRQVVPWTPLSASPLDGSIVYSQ